MWLFSDETINGHWSENLKYFPRVTFLLFLFGLIYKQ